MKQNISNYQIDLGIIITTKWLAVLRDIFLIIDI